MIYFKTCAPGDIPKTRKFFRRVPCPLAHPGLCIRADAEHWGQLNPAMARLAEFAHGKGVSHWLQVAVQGSQDGQESDLYFAIGKAQQTLKLLVFTQCEVVEQHDEHDDEEGAAQVRLRLKVREVWPHDGFAFLSAGGVIKMCYRFFPEVSRLRIIGLSVRNTNNLAEALAAKNKNKETNNRLLSTAPFRRTCALDRI